MTSLILGARSFNRRSLHHIGNDRNPYEEAISIIGRTLASFDEDNLIPCFGFGDGKTLQISISLAQSCVLGMILVLCIFYKLAASTHDQEVFSFLEDDKFCDGFEEVLRRYRELVPQLRLAGDPFFLSLLYTFVKFRCLIFIFVLSKQDLPRLPLLSRWPLLLLSKVAVSITFC